MWESMPSEETASLLKESEALLRRLERIEKFRDKYGLTPTREIGRIVEHMQAFADKIPGTLSPSDEDELLQSELRRRFEGQAAGIDQKLSGKLYEFDTVVNSLGIPREDILAIRPWLEANRDKTQEAVERLFHSREVEGYELSLSTDLPSVRRQSEEFAGVHIQRYHKVLGKFLQGLTNVGRFMQEINAVASRKDRSYFNELTNTLAIGIPAICFSKEDGTIHIRDRELIRLYGHEGMGHALNFVITKSDGLPYFLTQGSNLTVATAESVAQFYENVLLEDLRKSPETQRALGIEHKFEDIYQEAHAAEQLELYKANIFRYGITVLGDKSLGDPHDPQVLKKKAELIAEVAVDNQGIQNWIQENRYNFDSEGNLDPNLVSELRYCARPVSRALKEFSKRGIEYDSHGRSLIDATLLKGLWTPAGFVDNARLKAESAK